jgi:hypothetical protein
MPSPSEVPTIEALIEALDPEVRAAIDDVDRTLIALALQRPPWDRLRSASRMAQTLAKLRDRRETPSCEHPSLHRNDDDLGRRMRSGPRDAAMLAAQLRDHGRDDVFQAAWPHVRRFVQTRALGRNGLGWVGSFGRALLLAPTAHVLLERGQGARSHRA